MNNNKKTNPGNMGGLRGQISGCVKRSVKRFSFVLFIHHCKTVIKADQKSSLYPSINVYGTKNILRRDNAIATISLYLNLQKQTYKPRVYHILKVHPVSSFAPRISGLHKFGRKQRFLRFSTMHHGIYRSI